MSTLFLKFDKHLHKVEQIMLTLGTEREPFLPTKIRISLVDQLVQDAIDNKNRLVLLHDILRNGCLGFFQLTDIGMLNALHANILDDGIPDRDDQLPPILEALTTLLANYERKLLDD